jgi:gliding-associated putative ABC transporter substrate-binding component GldG
MAKNASSKRKSQQRQAVTRVLIMAAILVCINMLAVRFHYGLDLTSEKRFTLSAATKRLLHNMDDVAVINVYLKGKFPAGFQRLSEATRERLQSFRDVSGNKIIYKFIDPFEGKTEEEKGPISEQLYQQGIMAMNLRVQSEEEGYSEKFVFPYALVQYKGRKMAVRLLEQNQGVNQLHNLTASETLLEYKLANAINKLTQPERTEIAYIVGHGESIGLHTYDLLMTLASMYTVDTFDLASNIYIPKRYKAVIINKPTLPIDDREKFKIDQYIMEGGHVLWAIDQLYTPMDSMNARNGQQFITMDYGLELDDMLFKYGVRVNLDIIEDQQNCLPLPIIVNNQGNKPEMQLRQWVYYPVFMPVSKHPIVKNLNGIMGRFVNSIDTLATPGVKKTILLESSKYSRTEAFPVRVSLSMLKYPLKPDMFNNPYKVGAVLLEGKFRSVFENRMAPKFLQVLRDSLKRDFYKESDTDGKMIVISDGDIMDNDFSQTQGPSEMGYWKYIQTRFYNKEFILNCVEYLTDNSGLIEARAKDEVIRKLDGKRVTKEKLQWRIVNIGIPILLVLVFASGYIFFRKRRYEKVN